MDHTAIAIIDRAALRQRALRAVAGASAGLAGAVVLTVPVVALAKLGWLTVDELAAAIRVLAMVPVIGAAIGAARRVSKLALAIAVDRANDLDDRLANAWEVLQLEDAARDPYMRLHLARTATAFGAIPVRSALPVRAPAEAPILIAAALVLAVVASLAPPEPEFVPWEAPPPVERPRVVTAETSFERDRLERLGERIEVLDAADADEVVAELERIIDAIERGEDPRTVMEMLDALEARIEAARPAELPGVDEALEDLAEALAEAAGELSPSPDNSSDGAAEALEALADAAEAGAFDEETAEAVADALREFGHAVDPIDDAIAERLADAEEELARLEARYGGRDSLSESRQRRLDEARARAEELRAEAERSVEEGGDPAQRAATLRDEIRDAADAAESAADPGTGDPQPDLSAMADAARELRTLQREQAERDAMDEAERRAESIREMTQRSGASGSNGESRADAMREFLDRAGGEASARGADSDQGGAEPGRNRQPGESGGAGQSGAATSGDPAGPQGQSGSGVAGESGRQFQQLARERGEETTADGAAPPGGAAAVGDGHVDNTLLDPTELGGERDTTRARSEDLGEGATTSEIIAGAASDGFASTPYRRVYQDYARVHEETMERGHVPGGYRFYIRRYFELIAPR